MLLKYKAARAIIISDPEFYYRISPTQILCVK